jgi:hypothetical protein
MLSAVPSEVGAYSGVMLTNLGVSVRCSFCAVLVTHLSTTLPSSCSPGRISRSGTDVSTMVETIAIQTSLAATLCAAETAAM